MKIKELFIKYDDNNNFLNNLEIDKPEKIKAFLFGYLFALLIVLTPVILTAHFFIYSFYFDLVALILTLIIALFLSLGEIFNHKLLLYFSKCGPTSLKLTHLFDTFMYVVMCLISYVIIILLF